MIDPECTVKNSGFDPGGNGEVLTALGEGTHDQVYVWKCSVAYGVERGGQQTITPQICHFSIRII